MVNVNQKVINKKQHLYNTKKKNNKSFKSSFKSDYFRLKFCIAGENLNLIGGN